MHVSPCQMRICLAIATATLLGVSLLPGSAQEPPKWSDPKNNTTGVELTLQETKREHTARGTEVTYVISASGLPDNKTYQLWFANNGISNFTRVPLPPDIGLAQFLREGVIYTIQQYVKGEPLRIILTSTDQAVRAYAEAYPFPIEAKDGPCRLWVQIISHQGTAFAIFGEGFGADEDVTTTSQSGSEVIKKEEKAHSDGTLPVNIIAPAVVGKQSGIATFNAAGKSCAPTVNYEWGPPALKPQ